MCPERLARRGWPQNVGPERLRGWIREVGPVEVGPIEIGPVEFGPIEIGPIEVGPDSLLVHFVGDLKSIQTLIEIMLTLYNFLLIALMFD